jgi:hypothetical protein
MANRATARVFKGLPKSPGEIQRALHTFSVNAASFSMSKEEALEKYKNKWIAIYDGKVAVVSDSLEKLTEAVKSQKIPASQTLFRHISPVDKVFIL